VSLLGDEGPRRKRPRYASPEMPDRKRRVWGIDADVLDTVNEAAWDSLPNEFAAMLIAEDGVICELELLPGSVSTETSATMPLFHLPIDFNRAGSVHSHPGPSARPSGADLHLFSTTGDTHIITHEPFDRGTWRAYDRQGRPITLQVIE